MIQLGINKDQIHLAMSKGCIDILTIIPKDKIIDKGILHAQTAIESLDLSRPDKAKWNKF